MVKQLEQMKKDRVRNGLGLGTPAPPMNPSHLYSFGGRISHKQPHSSSGVASVGGCPGTTTTTTSTSSSSTAAATSTATSARSDTFEVVALHVSPDLGERIMLSAERALLDEIFPETTQMMLESRSNVSWNQLDGRQIIRFPLNGYCKLNSVQVLTRLLNAGFTIEASTGGGVEGQQFSEYLLVRKCGTML